MITKEEFDKLEEKRIVYIQEIKQKCADDMLKKIKIQIEHNWPTCRGSVGFSMSLTWTIEELDFAFLQCSAILKKIGLNLCLDKNSVYSFYVEKL